MSEFYKDQRKVEIRVGIVALVCMIILILGYAWLRNTLQLRAMTEVMVKFENAEGLEVGDKVTINGMEAGRVRQITQLNDGILINSQLRLKHPIREGARFLIRDSNLMGGKQMDIINFASGTPLDTKQVQSGEPSFGMTALLSAAAATMQQINRLLEEINKPEGLTSAVKNTLIEAENTFSQVSKTIENNEENLTKTLKELSAAAGQLNELLSENRQNLNRSIDMAPDLLQRTQATLDSLRSASAAMTSVLHELSAGKGTLPSLINDDTLYKNLLKSTNKLDSLLIDIRKNPTRYFRLKVF